MSVEDGVTVFREKFNDKLSWCVKDGSSDFFSEEKYNEIIRKVEEAKSQQA